MLTLAEFKEEIINKFIDSSKSRTDLEFQILNSCIKVRKGDNNYVLFFESMYERYQNGEDLDHLYYMMIEPIFDGSNEFELKETWEEVKNNVFPQFKGESLMGELYKHAIYEDSIIPTLKLVYVVDLDRSMMFVTKDMLETWNISEEEMKSTAMKNLKRLYQKRKLSLHKDGQMKFYHSMTNDGYDAVRILCSNFNQLKQSLQGRIFVGIPNRDCLIIFSDKNPHFRSIVDKNKIQYQVNRYRLTPMTFEWNGKRFKPVTSFF